MKRGTKFIIKSVIVVSVLNAVATLSLGINPLWGVIAFLPVCLLVGFRAAQMDLEDGR